MELNYTLLNHSRGYQLQTKDILATPLISPYAYRHWELAQKGGETYSLGHKVIAYFQVIPFFGYLASLIEIIIVIANQMLRPGKKIDVKQSRSTELKALSTSVKEVKTMSIKSKDVNIASANVKETLVAKEALVVATKVNETASPASQISDKLKDLNLVQLKMFNNLVKAIERHKQENLCLREGIYPNLSPKEFPLKLSVQHAVMRGKRSRIEDAHFSVSSEDIDLVGVCDGHADRGRIANYIASRFQNDFLQVLKNSSGNIKAVFTTFIDQVHQEVVSNPRFYGGSTAVIGFIDKKTHLIYVATVGDSEARVYRKRNGTVDIAPLSYVVDWSCPKEAARAAEVLEEPLVAKEWPKVTDPKRLRLGGLNVSRAIGDKDCAIIDGKEGVSHRPKVTFFQLQPDDIVMFGSDGLWDFVSNEELIETILTPNWDKKEVDIAALAAGCSVKNQHINGDNVTAIAVRL